MMRSNLLVNFFGLRGSTVSFVMFNVNYIIILSSYRYVVQMYSRVSQPVSPPKVSVIIPVYNAEQYLHQCLDSVCNQTLCDIEIICVDDGSTDNSLAILREYQNLDPRILVLTQENAGGGAARNHGLEVAKGEYLSFLDSDDFFELTLLEKVYLKCESDAADIGIFKYKRYSNIQLRASNTMFGITERYLPHTIPFSPKTCSEYIFELSDPVAWNKLFKREFVIGNCLKFQEIRRTNDLLFTMICLALADKITVINEALVYYRVGTKENCQTTNYKYPLDFYHALVALKDNLVKSGIWTLFEHSFVNMALGCCLYNLSTLHSTSEYGYVYHVLSNSGFEKLGILENKFYCHDAWAYWQCLDIYHTPFSSQKTILQSLKKKIYFLRYRVPQLFQYGTWNLRHNGIRYTLYALQEYII